MLMPMQLIYTANSLLQKCPFSIILYILVRALKLETQNAVKILLEYYQAV